MNKYKITVRTPIDINITEVSNKLIRQIRLTTEATSHIFSAIINFDNEKLTLLQTDNLPIVIDDPESELIPELRQERTIVWLFKKAFEEFIVGITESLIETHKYAKTVKLAESTITKSLNGKEEFDSKIAEINKRPLGLPIPLLIKEIEDDLNITLPYKSEIISINQVRNCLVHRNGIVGEKDINDKESNSLKLKYVDYVTLIEQNGEMIELNFQLKQKNVNTSKIEFRIKPKSIEFNLGEKVILDQNIFNGVSYNCISFTYELIALLNSVYESKKEKLTS